MTQISWQKIIIFADPITVITPDVPITIAPQRTNNILERFFRSLKRKFRKRSGTVSLSKTLKTILADTPLVKNLENDEYLQIILNGNATLEERFAQIDSKLVVEQLKLAQESAKSISSEMKKLIARQDLPQQISDLFVT